MPSTSHVDIGDDHHDKPKTSSEHEQESKCATTTTSATREEFIDEEALFYMASWSALRRACCIAHLISLGILTLDSSSAFCDGLSADPSMSRGKGKLPD
ncbi:hypothetical protein Sjap_020695 [Stephania japonica]|uniref:Uncharacterized protein n=1 Tax=Stephania japonica TaxID=461633 RepID=A0AAP0I0H5_9MAGN